MEFFEQSINQMNIHILRLQARKYQATIIMHCEGFCTTFFIIVLPVEFVDGFE